MKPRVRTNANACDSERVYHTERCRGFEQIDSPRRATRTEVERFRECAYCSGEYEPTTDQSRSLRTKLADDSRDGHDTAPASEGDR